MDGRVSPTGWNATFKPWRVEPVTGWDDLGYALIIEPASGRRITVHDLEDHEFSGLERAQAAIVGVLPGAGWTIRWADGEDESVVGFAVQADGVTRPLLAELDGHATPYYPDGADSSAQLRPPRADS